MATFEVRVRHATGPGPAVRLQQSPVRVGRGPANDIVIDDDTVSWHHAEFYIEGSSAMVRDLGSRNGTWLGGERLRQPIPVPVDAAVRFGARVEVVLTAAPSTPAPVVMHLEDTATHVRWLIRGERFTIGSDPSCDLRLAEGPARAATLSVTGENEICVGTDDAEFIVAPGTPFSVAGHPLRVVATSAEQAPTVEFSHAAYPYECDAAQDGPTGPQARLTDPTRGLDVLYTGNRGVLLLSLAQQLQKDREQGRTDSEEGWISDADVASAIWGASGRDANNLHVLVYRLRKQLQLDGFDPWFIEKRHWGLRARLRVVRCAERA